MDNFFSPLKFFLRSILFPIESYEFINSNMDSSFFFFFLLLLSKKIRIEFREYIFFFFFSYSTYSYWIKSFQTLFKHASLIFIVSRVPRHENNKIHSWSPFGQTYSSIAHNGFSYFDPRISYIIETCCWRIFTFQCQSSSHQRRESSWTARYSTSGWTPLSTGALPPNYKITFKNR